MKITRIGLDIAKQVFEMDGVDERGKGGIRDRHCFLDLGCT
jgi:hypothetical protein